MSSLAHSLVTSSHRSIATPFESLRLQAFAQTIPGAVQEHSKVIGGYVQNITDLSGLEAFHLTKREGDALTVG